MTYLEIYDFYQYLASNEISLSTEIKKDLLKSPLPKSGYFVVKYFDEEVIKAYLKYMDSVQVNIFLNHHIQKDLSSNELVEVIETIGSIENSELQVEMRKALEIKEIRQDSSAVFLFQKQDTKLKMHEMRKACENEYLRTNPEILNAIAIRANEFEMFGLRFYLNFDIIRKNEQFVNLLLSQKDAKRISEIGKSLLEEKIRNNPSFLEILNAQKTDEDIKELRLAYLEDSIRENPHFFELVLTQKTATEKKLIRYALTDEDLKMQPQMITLIANLKTLEEKEEVLSYCKQYLAGLPDEHLLVRNYKTRLLNEMILDGDFYCKIFEMVGKDIENWDYNTKVR